MWWNSLQFKNFQAMKLGQVKAALNRLRALNNLKIKKEKNAHSV